jgi:hypothetical protein
LAKIHSIGLPSPSTQRYADRTGAFGGKLQSARCGHGKLCHFGNNCPKTTMSKTFLETGKQGLVVASLNINNPAGRQACLGNGGREKVLAGYTPQHFSGRSCGNSRGKQGRRRSVHRTITSACNLMQTCQRQSSAGKNSVDGRDAKGNDRTPTRVSALKPRDAISKFDDSGTDNVVAHTEQDSNLGFPTGFRVDMFLICSVQPNESIRQSAPHRTRLENWTGTRN